MSSLNQFYKGSSDVNLWLKIKAGDDYTLADIPALIPLRWTYIKNNWSSIKNDIKKNQKSALNLDELNKQINDFDKFIDTQRNINKINPLSDSSIFYRYYQIFDNILINSISLTNEEQRIINEEIARINSFSKNNFIDIKNNAIAYRDKFSDSCGLGDDAYNAAFNRSAIAANSSSTISDVNYINNIQQNIKTIDFILANLFAVDAVLDPFALARSNANNPDLGIGQYSSGKLVRLGYNETLESLANRYLGDPDRWIDIAIANGLKPPYIDEVGERVSLISNGNGNTINISKTDTLGNLNINKLYINQLVVLKSNIQKSPDQRVITSIRQIPVSGEIIIELDGESNLNIYKINEEAHIRIYKPNTINSSQYILIPSNEPITNSRKEEIPWFLTKSQEDEKRAKIDIGLSDTEDLLLASNNDIRLSYGIDNAIQAIKLLLATELGSLPRHVNYGIVNLVGNKALNMSDMKAALIKSISDQISADNRFDRIESIYVDYLHNGLTNTSASALVVSLTVRLAGGKQVIPISFTVNNM